MARYTYLHTPDTAIAMLFVGWEMRRDDPMLDMSLFRNRSFSAGSIALALLFFAMAGTVFLQAQYLQFVLEYTPRRRRLRSACRR